MDPDPGSLGLLLLIGLLAANAFLVAAEFALIAVRRIRIEQNVRLGDPRAARVLLAMDRLEELAFAAQLARSAATIALGYHAVVMGRALLLPLWGAGVTVRVFGVAVGPADAVAAAAAMVLVILLHATLGQQVPKVLAVHRAEWITAHVSIPPLRLLALLLRPVLWPLQLLVRAILRAFGVTSGAFHPLVQTPEELRMLVAHVGDPAAAMETDERDMLRGVFEISETVIREVMTPRTDMIAVPVTVTLDALLDVATEEGHSRIPVYEGTIDSIVGVLLIKDLLDVLREATPETRAAFDVRSLLRPVHFVPDTKPVDELLSELRRQAVHLAIVLDEFGGTYGLVTLEDLLEEIVGEINDEYDEVELEFEATPEGDVLIDGGAALSVVNERLGLRLPEEEFDTVGGYVFGTLGRVALEGDTVLVTSPDGEVRLRVEETEERRVTLLRLCRAGVAETVPEPAEGR